MASFVAQRDALQERDIDQVLRSPCRALVGDEVLQPEDGYRDVSERGKYHVAEGFAGVDAVRTRQNVDAQWGCPEVQDFVRLRRACSLYDVAGSPERLERIGETLQVDGFTENQEVEIFRCAWSGMKADGVPPENRELNAVADARLQQLFEVWV